MPWGNVSATLTTHITCFVSPPGRELLRIFNRVEVQRNKLFFIPLLKLAFFKSMHKGLKTRFKNYFKKENEKKTFESNFHKFPPSQKRGRKGGGGANRWTIVEKVKTKDSLIPTMIVGKRKTFPSFLILCSLCLSFSFENEKEKWKLCFSPTEKKMYEKGKWGVEEKL